MDDIKNAIGKGGLPAKEEYYDTVLHLLKTRRDGMDRCSEIVMENYDILLNHVKLQKMGGKYYDHYCVALDEILEEVKKKHFEMEITLADEEFEFVIDITCF